MNISWENLAGFRCIFSLFCQAIDFSWGFLRDLLTFLGVLMGAIGALIGDFMGLSFDGILLAIGVRHMKIDVSKGYSAANQSNNLPVLELGAILIFSPASHSYIKPSRWYSLLIEMV